jgi:predicted TIM-barrel fold metal-dependent hydrolase
MDRLWGAAAELDLPLSLHILTNEKPIQQGVHIPEILQHGFIQHALTMMTFGGVFQRHPKLRVVCAETDAGWAPYLMERMDYIYSDPRRQTYQNYAIKGGVMLPSEYMKRNVYYTFMRDASAIYIRNLVGVGHLMWSSDYPHNDSTWPHSQEVINRLCAGIPEQDRRAIVAGNAAGFYKFS